MKKVTIAIITLICFGAASFAQTTPVVKKKADTKTAAVNKPAKPAAAKTVTQNPVNKTSTPTVAKATPVSKSNAVTKNTATKHTKKNGTPDKRFKENKKTS